MRRLIRSVMAVAAVPFALQAQGSSSCGPQTIDGCRKAEDLYNYMMPQFGLALAGGNPVLGSNGVIGRFGGFSVGLRVSAVKGQFPNIDETVASQTGAVATEDGWVPAPAIDAAIGLFKGFPLGVTRIGAIDGLVSFMYLPDVENDEANFSLDDGNTRFGFGARIGLLEESLVVPGVSVAILTRGLPKITASTETQDGYTIGVEQLDVSVTTWRIVATKTMLAFSLSAGFGGDTYNSDGAIAARAPGGSVGESVSLDQKLSRTNFFGGLTLNLGPIKLAGEIGRASGGSVSTFNSYDPAADAARTYVSVGLRIGS